MKLLLIIIAVIYVLLPYDLLPDFLAGWGWLDDLAVVFMIWRIYRALQQATARRGTFAGPGDKDTGAAGHRQTHDDRQERAAAENSRPQDPYTILGIAPDASTDEVKAAYRKLAARYHPDKVMHLGEEFQKLAERRFKEIQSAYQQIMAARGRGR